MLNLCGILAAILKIATGLPFSKWLPKHGMKNGR
jgi:hypothetical protein